MDRICVLGLGYIGLPTAAILASIGLQVVGVDINEKILENLLRKEIYIEENGLKEVVYKAIDTGNLILKSKPEEAEVFIIAVPTPKTKDNKCDLSFVKNAVDSIIPLLNKGNLIIIESTIPPGTTETIKSILELTGFSVGKDLFLAHCPERVLPGRILDELINNPRIIGGCTIECAKRAKAFYERFVMGEINITDSKTAEMAKLIENTYRDVNIALANEIVKICSKTGVDALKVIEFANKHPRVNILQPGPGVGGHCIAVDPYFIIEKAPDESRLISAAREVNSTMPKYIVSKVKTMTKDINQPKVSVFGVTYKENINDLRESPAIEIIELLIKEGYEIAVYDPHINNYKFQTTLYDAVNESDMILILTAHDEFKNINYIDLTNQMRTKIIFDTRNIVRLEQIHEDNILLFNLGNI